MASIRLRSSWGHLQRLFEHGTSAGLSEWQLLQNFSAGRDDAAFEVIVARHAPMVLGVCRRVLTNHEDVEDAFQATFLVLVRKAGSLRHNDSLGHWLYGVAYRVALRARSEEYKRRRREKTVHSMADSSVVPIGPDLDLGPMLDEELQRLPATYRAAIVLCYFDGQTHEEAALQLGWPVGTVKGRLSRARELLRIRLIRRGMIFTSASISALLTSEARGSVSSNWLEATVKAARTIAAGQGTTGLISTSVAALFEGVLWTMRMNQFMSIGAVATLCAAVVAGAGVVAQDVSQSKPAAAELSNGPIVEKTSNTPAEAVDPARSARDPGQKDIGHFSVQDSKLKKLEAAPGDADPTDRTALLGFQESIRGYSQGKLDADAVDKWSQRIAELESTRLSPAANAERHLERMKVLERIARDRGAADRDQLEALNIRYLREKAERLLKAADSGAANGVDADNLGSMAAGVESIKRTGSTNLGLIPDHVPLSGGMKPSTTPGKDARTVAIIKKLDEPVEMMFGKQTPLDEVIKHIKESTKSPEFPNGLAVYVDLIGLQEAEKTLKSPVLIELEGVPLRRTLQLVLDQHKLIYRIQDGFILITSSSSDQGGLPVFHEASPIVLMQQKSERGEMNAAERKEFIKMLDDLKEIKKGLNELQQMREGVTGSGGAIAK